MGRERRRKNRGVSKHLTNGKKGKKEVVGQLYEETIMAMKQIPLVDEIKKRNLPRNLKR